MPHVTTSRPPRNRLRILLVTGNLATGGAQAQMLALMAGFMHHGHLCWFLDLHPHLRNPGFVAQRLPTGVTELSTDRQDWHDFLTTAEISVVISFSPAADTFVRMQLLGHPGITFILRQCGDYNRLEAESPDPASWGTRVGPLFQSFDLHVSQHRGHTALLQRCGVSPSAIHLLRNGVTNLPVAVSQGWRKNQKLRMVMCARGEARKGWADAISATRKLLAAGWDVSLDLIGDGPVFGSIQWRTGEPIRWLGFATEPMEVLPGYDLGLLPTTYDTEGQPNSIVEYITAGLVTIASDIGGIPWLVTEQPDGHVGLLHQPTDANDLAAKILRYFEDPHLYVAHRAAVLKTRERFAMAAVTDDWLRMIVR